jgi:hypothetical protein
MSLIAVSLLLSVSSVLFISDLRSQRKRSKDDLNIPKNEIAEEKNVLYHSSIANKNMIVHLSGQPA